MGNTKHALIPEAAPSPAAEILDDLITTAEAAQLSNCVPENIRALARRGVIPIVAKVGRGQSLFSRRLILERVAAKRAGDALGAITMATATTASSSASTSEELVNALARLLVAAYRRQDHELVAVLRRPENQVQVAEAAQR